MPGRRRSSFEATRSRFPPRRCGARWPRPRSATISTAKTPRSTSSRSARRTSSVRRRRSTSRAECLALGVDARELCAPADTIQFCFSKGLSAPVGSILCGTAETVAKARRVRKLLGGAMRQAGVIAAAALVALEEMRDRLVEDHRNAKALAEGLARVRGVRIAAERVGTHIVSFEVGPEWMDAEVFAKACAEQGLRSSRYP